MHALAKVKLPRNSVRRGRRIAVINHLLSVGNFRRSTSKKSKIKLTLLFGLGWLSVPGAFSTAKRLPSGCTSKLGKTPRSVNWPGDQGRGLSAWKESPEAL